MKLGIKTSTNITAENTTESAPTRPSLPGPKLPDASELIRKVTMLAESAATKDSDNAPVSLVPYSQRN